MQEVLDQGPFFHGTKALLQVGDFLVPKQPSNYETGRISNYIYFSATLDAANGALNWHKEPVNNKSIS